MTGWVRFLGRKSAVVNLPYGSGFVPVQNRYRSWAALTGVPYSQVEQSYGTRQALAPRNGSMIVHLGAQWRSKQFPEVMALRDSLEGLGWSVALVAGPRDSLPAEVPERAVTRPEGIDLLTMLRAAEHVITNDSGPMHLAAFLGCRTTVIVRTSPIEEWLPPLTTVIASKHTPIGYRPHRHYMSDETLPGWPTVEEICATLPLRRPEVPNALERRGRSRCNECESPIESTRTLRGDARLQRRASVRTVLAEWLEALEREKIDYRLLAINDGSRDETLPFLEQAARENPERLLVLDKANSGHGRSCRAGYEQALAAEASWIFQIDSDGQCDPGLFRRFLAETGGGGLRLWRPGGEG